MIWLALVAELLDELLDELAVALELDPPSESPEVDDA